MGKITAVDMRDRIKLSSTECPTILVKAPSGRHFGMGMAGALDGFDIQYFWAPRKKGQCTAEDIHLQNSQVRIGTSAWIASPVNGENPYVSATLDLLRSKRELDTAAFCHILVNGYGKNKVQTSLEQWQMNGYMNCIHEGGDGYMGSFDSEWASLSEVLPSYSSQSEPTDAEEAAFELQSEIRKVHDTGLGPMEDGRGVILYLLTRRDVLASRSTRVATEPTWPWVRASLSLIEAKTGIDLGLPPIDWLFETVLIAMVHDQVLASRPTRYGAVYSVTELGKFQLSKAYLPIIDPGGLRAQVDKELGWLLHSPYSEINRLATAYRRNKRD